MTFPFLDLPAELRNKVYQYLLSTKYTKMELTYHERGLGLRLPYVKPPHRYDFHPAILQTNRQIHSEAADIFYRQNAFVALTCTILDHDIYLADLVTVLRGHYADNFKHHSLEVHLGPRGPQKSGRRQIRSQRVVVAGDDVPKLCCLFPQICCNQFAVSDDWEWCQGKDDIEINVLSNAVAQDEKDSCDKDPASVKRLLEPFRQLYGYHVAVEGHVTTPYKESIQASAAELPPTTSDVICIVSKGRDEGDEAMERGSLGIALSRYESALDVMTSAYKRLACLRSRQTEWLLHNDESDMVAMDILQLNLRSLLADTYLKVGAYAKSYRSAQDLHHWTFLDADADVSVLPNLARMMFCKARAGKALGEPIQALHDLDEALSYSPDDEAMEEERKVLCGLVREKLESDVRITWAGLLNERTGKLRKSKKVKRGKMPQPATQGYSWIDRKYLERIMDRK